MNVVDSSAWLAYFADEPNAEVFSEAIEDLEVLLVPSICVYEVFRHVLREAGEDAAFKVVAAMQQGKVVDLDFQMSLEAAALVLREKLAMADSIIYATTLRHEATLWTQDEHFKGKPQVEFRAK